MKNNITVKIHQKPEPRRKDSFWFNGHVATVTDGKITVNVVAMGHIDVCFNPNEQSYDNGVARKEAKERGYTDQKIKNVSNHDGWGNSNWFTFEIVDGKKEKFHEHTESNFTDAISYAKSLFNSF